MILFKKIKLKTFHCEILNDHEQLKLETDSYKDLPVIDTVSNQMVLENFKQMKKDVAEIIETELARILNTPGLDHLRSS